MLQPQTTDSKREKDAENAAKSIQKFKYTKTNSARIRTALNTTCQILNFASKMPNYLILKVNKTQKS